jgi:hypothetical protein
MVGSRGAGAAGRALTVALAAAFLLAGLRAAAGDTLLLAYWLTPSEEAQFSASDGAVSAFWGAWAGRDSMLLDPVTASFYGRDQWSADDDARVTVKVAGGREGLYLAVAVEDEIWIDTAVAGGEAEQLRVYVDSLSSSDIAECTDCLLGFYDATLTYTTEQLRMSLGGEVQLPDALELWRYEPDMMCLPCHNLVSFASASESCCITMEAVALARTKLLEARLAWALFSVRGAACGAGSGGLGTVPAAGSRQALCLTYADLDSVGQLPGTSWLSSTGKDPWFGDALYWGDIEFGPGFPPVATPVESLLAVTPQHGTGGSRAAAAAEIAYYTLTGQRLHVAALEPDARNAVLVRRTASGAGLHLSRP